MWSASWEPDVKFWTCVKSTWWQHRRTLLMSISYLTKRVQNNPIFTLWCNNGDTDPVLIWRGDAGSRGGRSRPVSGWQKLWCSDGPPGTTRSRTGTAGGPKAMCLQDWREKRKKVWWGENKTDSSKESNSNLGKVGKKDKTEEKWDTGARREWKCWLTELELEVQSLKGTRQDVGEHRGSEMQVRKHWSARQTKNMRVQKQEEGDQSSPPKNPHQ